MVMNYFVFGLVVVDILVGVIFVFLWMYILNYYVDWKVMEKSFLDLNEFYIILDSFVGIFLILYFMVIFMECYFCVGWVVKYCNIKKYVYYIVLFLVWFFLVLVVFVKFMIFDIKVGD